MQITREGECCPECVPKTGVCSAETPVRYSGDIWNISDCEYCVCNPETCNVTAPHVKISCATRYCICLICLFLVL